MVNGAPRDSVSTQETSCRAPFTIIHPRLFHRFSFLRCIGPVHVLATILRMCRFGKKLLAERSAERGKCASAPSSIIHNVP